MLEQEELEQEWNKVLATIESGFGKKPQDLNAVLFLIGVQELGKGFKHFSKEEKQDLMHIGTCKVLSLSDYYILDRIDVDGWPHYILNEKIPHSKVMGQEKILKEHIIRYFHQNKSL